MKICVYAISKNEEKFASRWAKSMSEADEMYVLDTGSTDNTVKILREENVNVTIKPITPWRFDTARNESLKLVPEDATICICTDLDEVFTPGWRKILEDAWTPTTTRARYNYNWSLDQNNNPKVNFYIEKIHSRKGYKWTHPVHEILTPEIEENEITIEDLTLNHYPDNTKSRSSYLPLLELSVKENPTDDRNMHYLGREYMYYGKWQEAISTLKQHLELKTATWKDERSASMRFISRCYKNLKDYDNAYYWIDCAIKETPNLRDPYVEKALLSYQLKNYLETEKNCLKALNIKTHPKTYINEQFSWDETVYDLLAISNYYQRKYNYAIFFNNLALQIASTSKRLLDNQKLYEEKDQLNQ